MRRCAKKFPKIPLKPPAIRSLPGPHEFTRRTIAFRRHRLRRDGRASLSRTRRRPPTSARGAKVALLISPKDVDQQAVKSARDLEIFTLPAVALQNHNYFSFARSFWQSWRAAKKIFQARPPQAVLAMGGFTSAPPVLAGNAFGAKTFLHESNTIPGRANRFLARFVNEAFVGFPEAAARLKARKVTTTGTPARPEFQPGNAARMP